MIKAHQFEFAPLSTKQFEVLSWWLNPDSMDDEAIICDGSVRAGKTLIMSLSYVMWSMSRFHGRNFGMAGKTIGSLRRNVVSTLIQMLEGRGYHVTDHRTENRLTVVYGVASNDYYLFGGKDESSQDLVQGFTAAGFFFDEVALMPQSFVNQALARCNISGSKYWFNCNPAGPYHWFKTDWIDDLDNKKALHIHFTMADNPINGREVLERYERMYSGVFYQRYILGLWVLSDGIVYDNFDQQMMIQEPDEAPTKYYVSCDYGTKNPTAFLLWGLINKTWYCLKEYYYDGRHSSRQKTDDEYAKDLDKFLGDIKAPIIVDPSAASFITKLRQRGYRVIKADNDVLDGIRATQSAMNLGKIMFAPGLSNLFKEFASYVWDDKAAQRGEDKVVKQHDHAMDAMRYFVFMVIYKNRTGRITKKPSWLRG
ncbi:PBSX family phage terminase large subunit [Lactobacillus sp. CBA3605]|uniref:PBSX family phage terminase large subunit n=1 Tax=Lactobacillus sp. CBA3605 TaxID=2099788 RepID=UPI000CFC31F0|nr:PBSX family phage terminase large subunit [Lactobacillus sp. CBA3605]AVK60542.1 PBSX family phage terminase large subunit [Lactobacillus sp. CBA3605]